MSAQARSIDVAGAGHNAPIPLGARVGPLLCSSAIAGKDRSTGKLAATPEDQVSHAFANLDALLLAGGATLADVVKLQISLADNRLRDAINTAWLARFPDPADRPARHISNAELQHGMVIQLEVTAYVQAAAR